MTQLKVLDCTLRDGGYYNNWDFDLDLVDEYLSAISVSGVSYVELGLRNFPKDEYRGPFAYTPESLLRELKLPSNIQYGVMVDAKTLLESSLPLSEAVNVLFPPQADSLISLVRIAAHFHEVVEAREIARSLVELGYIVGFNLMQAGGKSHEELARTAEEIESWNSVNVLYFADSLGNMDAEEVKRIVSCLRTTWSGEMGIHTHDNMGKGLENSLTAYDAGVTWLDATVTGMGRGAGNTATERLLSSINVTSGFFDLAPLYALVIGSFEPMKAKYGWGSNLLYFLGAKNDVHPTYIQKLLADRRLDNAAMASALDFLLVSNGTNKYDGKVLETALGLRDETKALSGTDLTGAFAGRAVFIITNAASVKAHKKAIELYIRHTNPVVISINVNTIITPDMIDITALTHNLKFLTDRHSYAALSSKVLLPMHRFDASETADFCDSQLIDYGLQVRSAEFSFESTYCCIPSELTLAYAVAAALAGGAEKIEVAGIDGYDFHDRRNSYVAEFFSILDAKHPVVAVTPTSYQVEKSSIYAHI